jgi:hypothetical protein
MLIYQYHFGRIDLNNNKSHSRFTYDRDCRRSGIYRTTWTLPASLLLAHTSRCHATCCQNFWRLTMRLGGETRSLCCVLISYTWSREHTHAIQLQFQKICLRSRGYIVWYEKIDHDHTPSWLPLPYYPTPPLTSDWPGPLFPTTLFLYKYGQFPACPHSHFITCW